MLVLGTMTQRRFAPVVLGLAVLLQLANADRRLAFGDPPGHVPPPVPAWAASFTDGAVLQRLVDRAIEGGSSLVDIP